MISLKEILNTVQDEQKHNLSPYEEWKITETDYLSDMGFKPNGNYCMGLENPPMLVYKKDNAFSLKDGKKKKDITFECFDAMVEYFDNYQQDLETI